MIIDYLPQAQEQEPAHLYLHEPDAMYRAQPQLHEAFARLYKYSPLAKHLIRNAEDNKLAFVKKPLGDKTRGEYENNVVRSSTSNSLDEDMVVLPHEIFHGMQPDLWPSANWDYQSRLLYFLAREAGAQTCATRVAVETKENGYAGIFNYFANPEAPLNKYAKLIRLFDSVYRDSKMRGAPDAIALLNAGDSAFNSYRTPDLIYILGRSVLKDCIQLAQSRNHEYPVPMYNLEQAKQQAWLGGDTFLIHEARIPICKEELFVGNKQLYQALEYVEFVRITKATGGRNSLGSLKKIKELEDDGNPFIGIDLTNVWWDYQNIKTQDENETILSVMSKHARMKGAQGGQYKLGIML